jgi:hypothetical protein
MRTVEVVQISGIGASTNVELYLNSKPEPWKLVQWKWVHMPSGATTDPHWQGVEATWEVPE